MRVCGSVAQIDTLASRTYGMSAESGDDPMESLIDTVSEWPELSVGPHRFNAVEFLIEGHEVGHAHRDTGNLDINFPKRLRDALVEEGRTDEHHYVPHSGWTTYRVGGEGDVADGVWLLRVSYLYRALNRRRERVGQAILAEVDVAAELDELGVSDRVREIFENVVEVNTTRFPPSE